MDLAQELNKSMLPHEMFSFQILGYNISVTDTVVVMWVIMAILIAFAYIITRNLSAIPKGKQNLAEALVESINNMVKSAMGHHWRAFAPYMGTIILFLAVSNIISIFDIIPETEALRDFALKPPTKDINVTASMAIMSIVLVIGAGIKYKKPGPWLKHFLQPLPFMLPFNILDYLIKPLSLCLRLFGNILAAFVIMKLIYIALRHIIPLAVFVPAAFSMYFDLFDGLLQAYIFVFLTSLYVGEAIE